jgi:class 3 adenylate cyclase
MSHSLLYAPDHADARHSGWRAEGFGTRPVPLHRTIICVDVEGFADLRRTNTDQTAVRRGLYQALDRAFTASRVPWREFHYEDRGDGALILIPSEVPKNILATNVPGALAAALHQHNQAHHWNAQIRLRLAIHAGEVVHDEHGVAGTAINLTARLLEAKALKRALRRSPGVLGMIASEWFFDEVIRHDAANFPAAYRKVRVSVKKTRASGWIRLPSPPIPRRIPAAMTPIDDLNTRATPAAAYVSKAITKGAHPRPRQA